MILRARSLTEVKMPRATTSRSILANLEFDLVEPGGIGRGVLRDPLGLCAERSEI
jgi:hypothetical protein